MTVPVIELHAGDARHAGPRPQCLYTAAARLVSLLAAGVLGLVLTLYPQAVMQGAQAPAHSALMLCMWGMAAGFVHGVGFVPHNTVLRIALGPLAAWLLMPGGTLLMAGI
jgi:predicted membrane protein